MSDAPILIASVSGGKDSAALCLHLRELGLPHQRVFMDTGWEHPALYEHLDYLEAELGPITRLSPRIPDLPAEFMPRVLGIEALVGVSPSAMVRWAVYKGMFPSRVRRYCTQELKIRPFLAFCEALDADIINAVGIRAAESQARATMPEREIMRGADYIEVWRPLIRWSEQDVIDIHARHNLRPCPLYLAGATRVGCWPCIMSNKGELEALGRDDRRVEAIRQLEALVGDMAEGRGSARPVMFQAPRIAGDDDRKGWPIEDVIAWAQTARGGRQTMLDPAWGREDGCVRWGMCDTGGSDV